MDLDGHTYYMRPQKWPMWYVNVKSVRDVRGKNGPPGQTGQFIFKRIGNTNFYLISTKKWPYCYLCMEDSYSAKIISHNGDPGKPGHWKATFTNDGYYQFSNEEWPKWYMYMQKYYGGNIAGCKGDPGPQGKFYLMVMRLWLDGSKHYLRKKCSDWYVYVDDKHDVQGHKGCPGSKGWFIFKQVGNEDLYLISTEKSPDYYIYMNGGFFGSNDEISTYKGDPGKSGHWYVTESKDGYLQLCSEKWPNWYMYMTDDHNVKASEGDDVPNEKFHQMEVSYAHECCVTINPMLWPLSPVYVEDDETGRVRSGKGPLGPRGHFIFKQVEDFYLISTQQRLDWYIYMQESDGNIRACKGDPGPQGHWNITTTKDGYKQLSTIEWPNRYMYIYMQGDGHPNTVKSQNGDPGPQGRFILNKVNE